MIKLEHDKRFLYQWDLNKRVVVGGYLPGTRVEFSHRFHCKETAPVTVVYEDGGCMYADIPNALLQESGYISVLVSPSATDTEHMPEEIDIRVVRRKKPEDYTYTETPTLSLESKVDKYWGEENKGKALIIGDDGCVTVSDPTDGGFSASVVGKTLIL